MIISDGITSLTFTGTTDDQLVLERQETVTAGGRLRTQTAGVRPVFRETNVRMTQQELRAFVDLMNNGASQYYYTPSQLPASLDAGMFPMAASIMVESKDLQAWGSERQVAHRYTILAKSEQYL